MGTQALDARLSQPNSYISNGVRLVRVLDVLWTGKLPTRERLIEIEDAYSGQIQKIKDDQLGKYEFVCQAQSDDEILAEIRAQQIIDSVAA